jgi:hypothetical protein
MPAWRSRAATRVRGPESQRGEQEYVVFGRWSKGSSVTTTMELTRATAAIGLT